MLLPAFALTATGPVALPQLALGSTAHGSQDLASLDMR